MSNRLPILADVANAAHEYTVKALQAAAEAARESGEALLEAKSLVPHGEWNDWLKANFKGGSRTAQRYMRVAKHWSSIKAKATRVSDLSVNEALRLLEARDELEEALVLNAEADALRHELDFLASIIDKVDADGLRFIIGRSQELYDQATAIRAKAIRESGRIIKEMEAQHER